MDREPRVGERGFRGAGLDLAVRSEDPRRIVARTGVGELGHVVQLRGIGVSVDPDAPVDEEGGRGSRGVDGFSRLQRQGDLTVLVEVGQRRDIDLGGRGRSIRRKRGGESGRHGDAIRGGRSRPGKHEEQRREAEQPDPHQGESDAPRPPSFVHRSLASVVGRGPTARRWTRPPSWREARRCCERSQPQPISPPQSKLSMFAVPSHGRPEIHRRVTFGSVKTCRNWLREANGDRVSRRPLFVINLSPQPQLHLRR